MEPDFSGYATRNNLKCSDGRTIMGGAFKHQHQVRVPLVWQHQYNEPANILGHAILEHREDGTYAYGYFNETSSAQEAKELVRHGDVRALSIYANNLSEKNKNVVHGDIREVSLVLAGANPGAFIDNINLSHADGLVTTLDDEAIIYADIPLDGGLGHSDEGTTDKDTNPEPSLRPEGDAEPADNADQTDTKAEGDEKPADADNPDAKDEEIKHAAVAEKTVGEVFETLDEDQRTAVYSIITDALESGSNESSLKQSGIAEPGDSDNNDGDNADTITHSQEEGTTMTRNIFEQGGTATAQKPSLSHDQLKTIIDDAKKNGSFKDAFLTHAAEYGFGDDIDILFPDAQTVGNLPELIQRRMEWVTEVINGTKHSPFARIKSIVADITADEARARGYVKGNLKKEEVVRLLSRKTTPTTIYKKQKLDRDDIVDITDLDVVAWLKAEMRLMLDEELARAILLGDGREYGDEDKIDEDSIRPIISDDDMYAHKVTLPTGASVEDRIEAIIRARAEYRGTGQPVFFTTQPFVTDLLLHKDKMGRRIYDSLTSLAAALLASKIVTVEVMEQHQDVVGVFVNLSDYTIGANRGGAVSMFDDFDIDYNQFKYLIETRVSGALTKPKSAVVIRRAVGTLTGAVTAPSFDGETNTITYPTTTGVVYTVNGEPQTGSVVITETTDVTAVPDDGYSFPTGSTTHWTYVYTPTGA